MKTFQILFSFLILLTCNVSGFEQKVPKKLDACSKILIRGLLEKNPPTIDVQWHFLRCMITEVSIGKRPALGPPPYLHRPKLTKGPLKITKEKRPILRPPPSIDRPKGPFNKMFPRQKRGAESIQCWQTVIF